MKIPQFIKSKVFKIYVGIGLLVYIIPFLYGLTSFVRLYLEDKTVFPDYIEEIKRQDGSHLVEVKVKKGSRSDLGRPTSSPEQNKEALMNVFRKADVLS